MSRPPLSCSLFSIHLPSWPHFFRSHRLDILWRTCACRFALQSLTFPSSNSNNVSAILLSFTVFYYLGNNYSTVLLFPVRSRLAIRRPLSTTLQLLRNVSLDIWLPMATCHPQESLDDLQRPFPLFCCVHSTRGETKGETLSQRRNRRI